MSANDAAGLRHSPPLRNPWLPYTHDVPKTLPLLCFPYAGGSAVVYHSWKRRLSPGLEVCAIELPGRAGRMREQPLENLPALLESLYRAVEPLIGGRFALFGYSLGALIAFEFARYLRAQGGNAPVHLFVAANRAPQLQRANRDWDLLDDDAFLDAVARRYGGMDERILASRDLRPLIVRVLRADLRLLANYRHVAEAPLSCPISVFGGQDDALVTSDALAAWKHQTDGTFSLDMLPGGHFFMHSAGDRLLDALKTRLS